MKLKEKIKKYSFWTSLSGAVVILLQTIGKQFGFAIDNQVVSDIIMGICGVLVVFGIVVKPVENNKEPEMTIVESETKVSQTIENEDNPNQYK